MIIIFAGQTASGKTTLKHLICESMKLNINVAYTTRPMRIGEINGIDYNFIHNEQMESLGEDIVCKRTYHTVHGDWVYGISLKSISDGKNYGLILDSLGARQLKEIMGNEAKIIYIDVPEQIRRNRAYSRERKTFDPEIERRFKSDAEDFENFEQDADIVISNIDKHEALAQIENYITEELLL